ncbi:MAG: Uma2 family endonuclease [Aggregatilineales bacterium]
MSALPQPDSAFMTEDEYLALERESEIKHEYMDGEIYAMTGGSEPHNAVSVNLTREFSNQLRRSACKVYNSEMRVKMSSSRNYTYPDLTVVCGEGEFVEDETIATLLNPALIIEVLSPSTEAYDRGKKFQEYRKLDSIKEYVLVAQDAPRIERFSRNADDTWTLMVVEGLDAHIRFDSADVELALEDVFEGVEFE